MPGPMIREEGDMRWNVLIDTHVAHLLWIESRAPSYTHTHTLTSHTHTHITHTHHTHTSHTHTHTHTHTHITHTHTLTRSEGVLTIQEGGTMRLRNEPM